MSITPSNFEAALKFLARYYTPVRLQDVLADSDGRGLPPRPVLVTFDDGYASMMEWAAPLCGKFGVPAIFFLNAAFLDNHRLAPDNLVCYVANVLGMETINAAVRVVKGADSPKLKCLADVFSCFFPAISLAERQVFLDALVHLGGINEHQLAEEAELVPDPQATLRAGVFGFRDRQPHLHPCALQVSDSRELRRRGRRNKAELEALTGRKVRSFSVPYGSSTDLTSDLLRLLELSGHQAVFRSESVANPRGANRSHLDRVSIHANRDDALFFEIEVLPRLRAIRNRLFRGLGVIRMARN